MEGRICYIVGAGEYYGLGFKPNESDYIIAADGGLIFTEKEGYEAGMVIGDFDSLLDRPKHPNVIELKKEKDDTDTFAAIREGIKLGYKSFRFYCCTGGRSEHTFANIQTLAYLSKNKLNGQIIGKDRIITALTDGVITFAPIHSGYISVFSYSEKSIGINIKGLKYELEDAVLENTYPMGVSNEFTGKDSMISVEQGTLLLIFPKEAGKYVEIKN